MATTYRTSDGYRCKTETAMVEHILAQIKKGNKGHFIFTKRYALAKALAEALHKKRVSACLHGYANVIIDPSISLREAMHFIELDDESVHV